MPEKWIIKRALTGVTLNGDAPVQVKDQPTRTLNGAGAVRFTLTGSIASRPSDVDGLPLIQEWGTRVYKLDANGDVVWGGIVVSSDDSATDWVIEAHTDSTILFGTPYLGPVQRLAETDPADIIRLIFHHVQGQANSDLGIEVVGSTNIEVGSRSSRDALNYEKAYNAAIKAYDAEVAERKRLADIVADSRKTYSTLVAAGTKANAELAAAKRAKPKDPARVARAQTAVNQSKAAKAQQNVNIKSHQADVDAQTKVVAHAKSVKSLAYDRKVKANERARADGGAYEMLWWEAPDCGRLVQDLADDGPFDYLDEWVRSGDTITSRFSIMYPRAGRLRNDIVFEQGRNVIDIIEATVDGDKYASEVVGIGAGEGSRSIRRSTARVGDRIRRAVVITDKTIKTEAGMDRRINRELAPRLRNLEVQKLRVRRINDESWDIGDDVHIKVTLKGHGMIDVLHRIVEEQPVGNDIYDLTLERSDSFLYGG